MPDYAKLSKADLIPNLRYRDAPAAIDWLERVFGFEKRLVVPGPDGTIAHAQLTFGNGMVMLSSAGGGDFDNVLKPPEKVGDPVTQATYAVVQDADVLYARAKEAGAEIVREIQDEDYGGRDFTCRDPEGNIWSFGSYDPWAEG